MKNLFSKSEIFAASALLMPGAAGPVFRAEKHTALPSSFPLTVSAPHITHTDIQFGLKKYVRIRLINMM
ncbi:MAG: hypothetical protein HUJ54_06410 [Erysipelotrichaceae bacterium]|nr:hypothetical protein [Erysipelotrichaceae bacterium]